MSDQVSWHPDEVDDIDAADPTPADEPDYIADAHISGMLLGILGIVCVAVLLGAGVTFLLAWWF